MPDLSGLRAGDYDYMSYVGPPNQYDIMGATQFRLLCTLGLRANHYLLDFGCGSLRAGKFFINYLDENRYFGIDPNDWLISDSIRKQIGEDLVKIKKPKFDSNSEFRTDIFPVQFDFIVAQSIFSHAGTELVRKALTNFSHSLKDTGMIAATFVERWKEDHQGAGWVYPGCVFYRRSTVCRIARETGLYATKIPWYHPRQSWFLFTKQKRLLPRGKMRRHLKGVILYEPEFSESWKLSARVFNGSRRFAKGILHEDAQEKIKKMQLFKAMKRLILGRLRG